ncbi:MAG: hypothetical protein CL521_01905 [Actinobacteria bacterium]|nr:hypothetical protein [Actinomycetota bacterium]
MKLTKNNINDNINMNQNIFDHLEKLGLSISAESGGKFEEELTNYKINCKNGRTRLSYTSDLTNFENGHIFLEAMTSTEEKLNVKLFHEN